MSASSPFGPADWGRLLAIELSLGIKSKDGQLLAHRQNVPCIRDLFAAVATRFTCYQNTSVFEMCEDINFQTDCDGIFDEFGPMVWMGPSTWLIKASDKQYGTDFSADCYWNKLGSNKKDL